MNGKGGFQKEYRLSLDCLKVERIENLHGRSPSVIEAMMDRTLIEMIEESVYVEEEGKMPLLFRFENEKRIDFYISRKERRKKERFKRIQANRL